MDFALLKHASFLDKKETLLKAISEVQKVNGLFTFIFHNYAFSSIPRWVDFKSLFNIILDSPMKFQNKEHIFFDLDHTLWDFDKNSALTFEKIFALNDLKIDLNAFLEVYVPINFNYWKLYREDKVDKKNLKFARLNDTFKALGIDVSAGVVHKLSDDYITYLSTFNHLFDGTIELLEYLQAKYKLHIITNGFKEAQQAKLNQSILITIFNCYQFRNGWS